MLENQLKVLSENLGLYSSNYGKIILLRDFNVRIEDQKMKLLKTTIFKKKVSCIQHAAKTQAI